MAGSDRMNANLWKPEYLLDLDTIDSQHKRFFELCLNLAHLCEPDQGQVVGRKEVIRAIFELRQYAFLHFGTEETLMVKHGYGECLAHFREHDGYLERLRGFVEDVAKLSGSASGIAAKGADAEQGAGADKGLLDLARRLADWAAGWWGGHILEHDKQYARVIKEKKGRGQAE